MRSVLQNTIQAFVMVALLYAGWTLDAKAPDGSPVQLTGQTTDVARRQPDGRWLYAIDSPFGAGGL